MASNERSSHVYGIPQRTPTFLEGNLVGQQPDSLVYSGLRSVAIIPGVIERNNSTGSKLPFPTDRRSNLGGSSIALDQMRELIVGVRFTQEFFQMAEINARENLHELRRTSNQNTPRSERNILEAHTLGIKAAVSDRDLISRHVLGLSDIYRAQSTRRQEVIDEAELLWKDYPLNLNVCLDSIDPVELKERVTMQSMNWDRPQIREVLEQAYRFSLRLSEGEGESFRDMSGLQIEGAAKIKRYARRIARTTIGLPPLEVSEETPIPPWQESISELTEVQRRIADKKFKRVLFNEFRKRAIDHSEKGSYAKYELTQEQYIGGLIDAYFAIGKGDTELRAARFVSEYGPEGYTLWDEARETSLCLDEKKSEIFAEARSWDIADEHKIDKEIHSYAKQLPRKQRDLVYLLTNTEKGTKWDAIKRWGATLGINVITDYLETASVGAFSYLVSRSIPESINVFLLSGLTARSYLSFFSAVSENLDSNYRALHEEGTSTRVTSKIAYDWFQTKFAAAAGYIAPEILFEIYAVANLIVNKSFTEFCEFLLAANIGGSIYERLISASTNKLLDNKDNRINQKAKSSGDIK